MLHRVTRVYTMSHHVVQCKLIFVGNMLQYMQEQRIDTIRPIGAWLVLMIGSTTIGESTNNGFQPTSTAIQGTYVMGI